MAHPDFSLQFQGKVAVDFLALAHFFGPPQVLSHISHTSNTKKWARSQKSGPGPTYFKANARSLKTFFALSERFTASSIEESLSRK